MGDRPRGLQRRRRRLELLHPRPGPLARLPLGRGRPGRHLRRPAAALLRAGPVERQGSDPQGAPLRPDQQREQSRRGRQGVLLLPRQHADPFVHEVPLQVSAGGLSRTPTWSRPAAAGAGNEFEYELLDTGVFDQDRYFDVFVEYAKESPEDILIQITRPQPRSGAGRVARPADALVPQPVVLARRLRPAEPPARSRQHRCEQSSRPSIPNWASATSTARATCRCCSPRTKRTPSAFSASPIAARTSRTASTTTSSTAARRR